jgi:hypothetical protein
MHGQCRDARGVGVGVDPLQQGLRCQDVHAGLRDVDPSSPLLAPLADPRVIGMVATLAGLIRGRDAVIAAGHSTTRQPA